MIAAVCFGHTFSMSSLDSQVTVVNPAPVRLPCVMAALTPDEIAEFFPDPAWSLVQQVAERLHVINPSVVAPEKFQAELAATDPEVLLACWKTPPLPAILPPKLRYVCYLTGSVRRLLSRAHLEQGILVTNWGSSISRIVAEGALFHILSCLRRASEWCVAMHVRGGWKTPATETASLFGRQVGLHGFGQVARELVKLLQPFSADVSVFAPDVTAETERIWKIRRSPSLDALFSENDIIVELAPLIPETHRVVQESHLRRIRSGGAFVNVARGNLVDEDALVRVAREGKVQFGLDVFAVEPLPVDHPLRGMLNVSLTPHLAGPTNDRRRDAGAWALRNLRAYVEGRPLEAAITALNYDLKT
jgi:phosphoglycerate dehydrogenase-like enzyme